MIWTKFELVDDPETDELTKEARAEIESYVDRTFVQKCGKDNVSYNRQFPILIFGQEDGNKRKDC